MKLADGKSTIEVGGIAVEMDVRGSGKPLLFLHPEIGFDRAEPALELLSRSAQVIAPTHPGYGKARLPPGFNAIDDLAYLYLDLIEALDLREAAMVGAGIGGWIAAAIAVKTTAHFRKMVLVDAFGIKIGDRETRDIFDMYFVTDADLAKVVYFDQQFAQRDASKLPEETLYAMARAREATSLYGWRPYMHDPKLKGRLHRIRITSLVLWGAEDRIVAPDYGRAYCAAIPGARFETIERGGHFPHVERPEEFARAVLGFIEEKERSAP
ncbi:MAG: alpha/beta fold hydrolase [Stellaceae bacterium]